MKNILKSVALAALFFIVHWAVQIIFTFMCVGIIEFMDLVKGVLKYNEDGTLVYKNAEISLEEVSRIYSSMAALPAIIITAVFLLFIYWIIFKILKIDFKEYINLRKLNMKQYIQGFMFGVTSFLPVIFLIYSTSIKNLSPEIEVAFQNIIQNTPFILQLLGMGIVAPIIEEITFRGLIYSSLKKSMPVITAVLVQALLFGFIHMNLQQFIYASLLGILFGFILEWSGSILTTILAHIGFNTFSLLMDKLFSLLGKIFHEQQLALFFLLFFIASFVSCFNIVYNFYKKRNKSMTQETIILDRNDYFY